MAGRGATTFQKRQKEQQRKEKQQQKFEKKLARKSEVPGTEKPEDDSYVIDTSLDVEVIAGVDDIGPLGHGTL
jgi:hypothetical protein